MSNIKKQNYSITNHFRKLLFTGAALLSLTQSSHAFNVQSGNYHQTVNMDGTLSMQDNYNLNSNQFVCNNPECAKNINIIMNNNMENLQQKNQNNQIHDQLQQQNKDSNDATRMPTFFPPPPEVKDRLIQDNNYVCDYYIGHSKIPVAGRGILSGRDFKLHELIEESITIPILQNDASDTQLSMYVFNTDDPDWCMALIGPASLYNSVPYELKNSQHYWSPEGNEDFNQLDVSEDDYNNSRPPNENYYPYSFFTTNKLYTLKEMKAGHEFFTDYGETWFSDRNINIDNNIFKTIFPQTGLEDDLKNTSENPNSESKPATIPGICLSDVVIGRSTVPLAGRGLYARDNFKKGELVTLSPTLVLDMKKIRKSITTSTLINYLIADPSKTDMALFPISYPSLINHAGEDRANIFMDWFDWNEVNEWNRNKEKDSTTKFSSPVNDLLNLPPEELLNFVYAPFDLGFYAARDIQKGEELFIDYGEKWEKSFKLWQENNKECVQDMLSDPFGKKNAESHSCYMPFRYPIEPPEGLFPEHWKLYKK